MFLTIDDIKVLLAAGKALVLAGDEELLRAVPRGNWIGGTIPYFMTADGGMTSRERIFVNEIPSFARALPPIVYDERSIDRIAQDAPESGYTILILPANTGIHQRYALEAPQFKDLFLKPIAGWISGIHLDDSGRKSPKTVNGLTGEILADRGVALHVELPATHRAQIGIVNIFEPGEGDEIRFPVSAFEVAECTINGERQNFHDYFVSRKLDARLPLVARSYGATINVSVSTLQPASATVRFAAPVFEGVAYRLARPVDDYPKRFAEAIPSDVADPVFCCNCIHNYLYGELENRHTGRLTGPMSFGEIAFQLLNQTMVYVTISAAG